MRRGDCWLGGQPTARDFPHWHSLQGQYFVFLPPAPNLSVISQMQATHWQLSVMDWNLPHSTSCYSCVPIYTFKFYIVIAFPQSICSKQKFQHLMEGMRGRSSINSTVWENHCHKTRNHQFIFEIGTIVGVHSIVHCDLANRSMAKLVPPTDWCKRNCQFIESC